MASSIVPGRQPHLPMDATHGVSKGLCLQACAAPRPVRDARFASVMWILEAFVTVTAAAKASLPCKPCSLSLLL